MNKLIILHGYTNKSMRGTLKNRWGKAWKGWVWAHMYTLEQHIYIKELVSYIIIKAIKKYKF